VTACPPPPPRPPPPPPLPPPTPLSSGDWRRQSWIFRSAPPLALNLPGPGRHSSCLAFALVAPGFVFPVLVFRYGRWWFTLKSLQSLFFGSPLLRPYGVAAGAPGLGLVGAPWFFPGPFVSCSFFPVFSPLRFPLGGGFSPVFSRRGAW